MALITSSRQSNLDLREREALTQCWLSGCRSGRWRAWARSVRTDTLHRTFKVLAMPELQRHQVPQDLPEIVCIMALMQFQEMIEECRPKVTPLPGARIAQDILDQRR